MGLTRQQRRARARELAKQLVQQKSERKPVFERPPQTSERNRRSIAERIQNHPVVVGLVVLAAIATLAGTYAVFVDTFPTVEPSNEGADASHDLPFVVRNESYYFGMSGVVLTCVIAGGEYSSADGRWTMSMPYSPRTGTIFSVARSVARIDARDFKVFLCDETRSVRNVTIAGQPARLRWVKVRVDIDYQTTILGLAIPIARHGQSHKFTRGDSTNWKWVAGEIGN